MSPKKETQKPGKSAAASNKKSKGFSDDELAAMKARAQDMKAEARANKDKAEGESAVLAAIAAMRRTGSRYGQAAPCDHQGSAPALSPKTWYGMPAYAKDGNVVCFFQSAQKFKTRYATLGFSDKANLDEGTLWPTVYAVKELTSTEEAKIIALVKKAVS